MTDTPKPNEDDFAAAAKWWARLEAMRRASPLPTSEPVNYFPQAAYAEGRAEMREKATRMKRERDEALEELADAHTWGTDEHRKARARCEALETALAEVCDEWPKAMPWGVITVPASVARARALLTPTGDTDG